jgi:hypothetical protein
MDLDQDPGGPKTCRSGSGTLVFPIAACDSKICPKTACDTENVSKAAMNICMYSVHWEKETNASEGKPEQTDAAFGKIFRISKCFQRSKQKLSIYFLLNRAG